ncbi:hypothetical protein OAE69_01455 [Gammaproteobacteria bacterium]|nr:hypothetical protein [Gammaproteobacteria bacterium]
MAKYKVTTERRAIKTFFVEAESQDEAEGLAVEASTVPALVEQAERDYEEDEYEGDWSVLTAYKVED